MRNTFSIFCKQQSHFLFLEHCNMQLFDLPSLLFRSLLQKMSLKMSGKDIDIKEYEFYCVKKIKKQKSMFSKLNNFGINLNLNIKFGSINKVSNKLKL